MQMLHPFDGSIQEYLTGVTETHRWKPSQCPLCQGKDCLVGHGFYQRSVLDEAFDGIIRICRYFCRLCRRTISLLPGFLLPYLRFSIPVLAGLLKARLIDQQTFSESAQTAGLPAMPYQRGQYWVRRFLKQASDVAVALVALTAVVEASSFALRALRMLDEVGWIRAHHFLLGELRIHLLGWPPFLTPDGRCRTLKPSS